MIRFYLNRIARVNPPRKILRQCDIIDSLTSLQRLTQRVKFSVPAFSSEDAAKASGDEVRAAYLARLAKHGEIYRFLPKP